MLGNVRLVPGHDPRCAGSQQRRARARAARARARQRGDRRSTVRTISADKVVKAGKRWSGRSSGRRGGGARRWWGLVGASAKGPPSRVARRCARSSRSPATCCAVPTPSKGTGGLGGRTTRAAPRPSTSTLARAARGPLGWVWSSCWAMGLGALGVMSSARNARSRCWDSHTRTAEPRLAWGSSSRAPAAPVRAAWRGPLRRRRPSSRSCGSQSRSRWASTRCAWSRSLAPPTAREASISMTSRWSRAPSSPPRRSRSSDSSPTASRRTWPRCSRWIARWRATCTCAPPAERWGSARR